MDDIVDDLVRIARRCERAYRVFAEGEVTNLSKRLSSACDEVGISWSGSNLGYHASVYLAGFRRPWPGEVFDKEWGLMHAYSNRTAGDWYPFGRTILGALASLAPDLA
jgi:hypothetical protein